jgi:hypothetical protein
MRGRAYAPRSSLSVSAVPDWTTLWSIEDASSQRNQDIAVSQSPLQEPIPILIPTGGDPVHHESHARFLVDVSKRPAARSTEPGVRADLLSTVGAERTEISTARRQGRFRPRGGTTCSPSPLDSDNNDQRPDNYCREHPAIRAYPSQVGRPRAEKVEEALPETPV